MEPSPLPSIEARVTHDPRCSAYACLSEMYLVFDTETSECSCKWLPGLEPSLIPTPEPTVHHSCLKIFCIEGQKLVYNATSGICACETRTFANYHHVKSSTTASALSSASLVSFLERAPADQLAALLCLKPTKGISSQQNPALRHYQSSQS